MLLRKVTTVFSPVQFASTQWGLLTDADVGGVTPHAALEEARTAVAAEDAVVFAEGLVPAHPAGHRDGQRTACTGT